MKFLSDLIARLNKAGFEAGIFSKTDGGAVWVKDPVQCSSGGGKKWVEHNVVVLSTDRAVSRFIDVRS